jgi:flagellar basal body-associated protein FliL
MQVFLGIISIVFLGGIIYFVISSKSSRLLRISAIIALALIGLSLGVCGVFLIRGPAKSEETVPLPFLIDAQPKPEPKTSKGVIIGYFAAFLIIAGLVAYSSKKEKGRKYEPEKKVVKKEVFQSTDENKLDLGAAPGDDETFDIGDLD